MSVIIIKHKNDFNSVTFFGTGVFLIISTFSGKGKTPSLFIQNPKYVTSGCKNTRFLNFSLKASDFSIDNADFKCSKCST